MNSLKILYVALFVAGLSHSAPVDNDFVDLSDLPSGIYGRPDEKLTGKHIRRVVLLSRILTVI